MKPRNYIIAGISTIVIIFYLIIMNDAMLSAGTIGSINEGSFSMIGLTLIFILTIPFFIGTYLIKKGIIDLKNDKWDKFKF